MSKKIGTLLILAAVITMPVFAASNSAQMTVSVQVLARTIVTVDREPATVDVTPADVARGYVDLPQSVLFHVRSNAANGYTVQFEPVSYPFNRADINWGDTFAAVGAEGAWLSHPYQQGSASGTFNVKLTLAAGTQPGSYAWPVRFDAGSL